VKCIVTAGPTYEPLDEVRRLTNLSTGRLGSELARHLSAEGHSVTLLKGQAAVYHGSTGAADVITFTTTADLRQRLHALADPRVQAVFHAAAVSDFGFGRVFRRSGTGELAQVDARKFSTGKDSLLVELVPTPKIISELRAWFPHGRLVGWKYEVDGTRQDALRAGAAQIERCGTDACVVNGAAYGQGFGFLGRGAECVHLPDTTALFAALTEWLVFTEADR
jgi:phosphopantothenoylcysteine decarboxylase/phosphopantothenate--cysteine ligase